MVDFSQLEKLLENQFGPFIRDKKYKKAFEKTMKCLYNLSAKEKHSSVDTFYLFLHALIIELFEEINHLHHLLDQLKQQTSI